MAQRFPLQSLLDYSQHRMDAAERLLRLLRHKEERARQRLEELKDFRQEYQTRLAGSAAEGMHIHLLRDYHAFLGKIEQAVHLQEQEVALAHSRWDSAHKHWLDHRQKVKAYETLAARHVASEHRKLEKREQRLTDEQAAKQHIYRSDAE
jgi:flagellar protein FliJ